MILYEITPITNIDGKIVEIKEQDGILGIEDTEKRVRRFFYATKDGKILLPNDFKSKFKIGDFVSVRSGILEAVERGSATIIMM